MPHTGKTREGRPIVRRIVVAILGLVLFATFVGLGVWQIERRSWKLALIARVDGRVHAAAVPAPGPKDWPDVTAASDEYRHVRLSGHFLNGREAQVYTATDLGPGYWVMTPLKRDDGTIVLVNRGFVPLERRRPATRRKGEIDGETTVTGLMRMSEPGGTLLRDNRPADDRWYSRDVRAIAQSRGLSSVAPYFVDADATPNPDGLPVGGLTRIHFRNAHLQYAITWFAMALLTIVGAVIVWRYEGLPAGSDRDG